MGADPDLIALGRAVRQLREERAISTRGLAAAAGIDVWCLEAIQDGRHDPTFDVLLGLAEGLAVDPEILVLQAKQGGLAFGGRLRALRTCRGLSQEALAHRVGLDRASIAKLERPGANPRLATILRLARSVGVRPGELVEGLREGRHHG